MKRVISFIAMIALVALIGVSLFACIPKEFADAKAKLEKKGYEVNTEYPEETLAWLKEKYAMTSMLEAKKGEEWVQAFLFESKDAAEDYYEKNEGKWKLEKEDAKKNGTTFAYGKSGKWVYCGTRKAVRVLK